MDELVNQVAAKTGLPRETARAAVEAVLAYLKEKLPEPIAGQIEAILGGGEASQGGKDLLGGLGGMFGGKR